MTQQTKKLDDENKAFISKLIVLIRENMNQKRDVLTLRTIVKKQASSIDKFKRVFGRVYWKTCVILLLCSPVMAESYTYSQIGSTTYRSDGVSFSRIGSTTYGSDGSSYSRIGSTTYGSDGTSYSRIGSTTYTSDGRSYSTIGSTTYGSDGSQCSRIGSTTYCNR
jgi:hypothetical protein